jgi:hypothetical protein
MQYDYDDVSLLLTAIRCINNTSKPAYGWAARETNYNVNYEATFPANQTTEFPINNGVNNRLQLVIDAPGRVHGVEYRLRYPA